MEIQTRRGKYQPLLLRLSWVCFVVMLFVWMALRLKAALVPYDQLPFHATVWRSARTPKEKEQRAKMAGDLVRNHLKAGMTDKEITALLGPPDSRPSLAGFAPIDKPEVQEIYKYDMGLAWMDITGQHLILLLYFNAKSHYLSYNLTAH